MGAQLKEQEAVAADLEDELAAERRLRADSLADLRWQLQDFETMCKQLGTEGQGVGAAPGIRAADQKCAIL